MRRAPIINIALFLLTFVSTLIVGAMHAGVNIMDEPWNLSKGLPFSLTLLVILLVHEFSHFMASRRHGVEASLPYFIPAPTLFGTLGAFIKMKSPITTRNALMDIGSAGPLAGFIVSVVAVVAGLNYSEIHLLPVNGEAIMLGDSLLFSGLVKVIIGTIPDSYDIYLHPVAFAGWIGFFVTSLNLIPIGQLDGGHIAYAIFGERYGMFSKILVGVLVLLGILVFEGWLVWAVLLIIIGPKHPPVLFPEEALDKRRIILGWAALIIFVITFIPVPVMIK